MSKEEWATLILIKDLESFTLTEEQAHYLRQSQVYLVYDHALSNDLYRIVNLEKEFSLKLIPFESTNKGSPGQAILECIQTISQSKIIVTMGDKCDDWSDMKTIASSLDHHDIVVASRFIDANLYTGGSQLKELVTKAGAIVLKWRWGWNISDPTNNYKGYRKEFLSSLPALESNGFSIALEVMVQAHKKNARIIEIPSRWRDLDSSSRWMKRIPSYVRYLL